MRQRVHLIIISAVILFTGSSAYPQAIIQVSPDGSLIIQDCSVDRANRSLDRRPIVQLLSSGRQIRVISADSRKVPDYPIITRRAPA